MQSIYYLVNCSFSHKLVHYGLVSSKVATIILGDYLILIGCKVSIKSDE